MHPRLLGLVLVAALVAGGACSSDGSGGGETVPPKGQAEVSGMAGAVRAEDAVAPPLPVPLAFATERGAGGVTFEGVLIDGARSTVRWDSGQPLNLAGRGSLDLGPARVAVDQAGLATWELDGAVRVLTPGDYEVDAAVAVGQGGLGEPRDRAAFQADGQSTVESRGGVTVQVGPAPLTLEGPGRVVLEGRFSVQTNSRTREADRLEFGPGPFVVEMRPEAGGLAVDAVLKGPLQVG